MDVIINLLINIFIVLMAVLPVVVLLVYIYVSDRYRKEPINWLLISFLSGIVAAVITTVAGYPMFGSGLYDNDPFDYGECVKNGFLHQAIPAEVVKFVMLWMLLHLNKYYDEHVDSIVYSTCISLGYVGVNNLYYLFSVDNWLAYGLVYAVILVPFHFAYGAVMGYFYDFSRSIKSYQWVSWIVALVISIIVDGFASSVLMALDLPIDRMRLFPIFVIGAYLVLFFFTRWGIRHLLEEDRAELLIKEDV